MSNNVFTCIRHRPARPHLFQVAEEGKQAEVRPANMDTPVEDSIEVGILHNCRHAAECTCNLPSLEDLHTSLRQLTQKVTKARLLKILRYVFVFVLLMVSIFIAYNITSWRNGSHIFKGFGQKTLGNQKPAEPYSPDLTKHCAKMDPSNLEEPGPYHVSYPGNYHFIMDKPDACKTKSPFLVLIVPVAPHNLASRDTIRRTWGNETLVLGQRVLTLFLLGLPGGLDAQQQLEKVRQESRTHRDLIQSNFTDSYHNLTIKTMVMLDWLVTRCPSASYAMKIDSDMFLNVQNLVKMLLDAPRENYMSGLVWWHSPVLRDPSNKFFLPREVIAEPEYPPYPLGMAYVMSIDIPLKILGVSCWIKPIFIEDAYLGMCLKRLGISPTNPPSFEMFQVNPLFPLRRCALSRVVAVTVEDIPQLLRYWEESRKPGVACLT